ncbi:MAG: replication-associated recombination protein A [Candidatus Gracilibacteria bacterium]|nr:replication-associated recombination protein A [Candidatus Gracilibacteria bacterium]
MESLFSASITPLASLLRPMFLDDYVGQSHLVAPGKPIHTFLKAGKIPSLLLWGPPGTGKTSLARIIANSLDAEFFHLSGVLSKKDDVIKIISKSQTNFQSGRQTILFLDEIHRWSKSQQDTLLPWVEKGIITLIGATTENPSFTVNNALLSRCRTYVLQSLKPHDIEFFLKKHIETIESRFPNISLDDEALKLISEIGDGDLRNTLNLLETACILQQEGKISREIILESGNKNLNYDKNGEEHYNLISAMHKSLRDSDGDAAIYWIGRMLAGGEDPRYIVRRMMNFASEDVFDPQAIILANSVYEICEKMGMPECELPMLNLAYYLADLPKNNAIYLAQMAMHEDLQNFGNLAVPMHLRNAPTKLMKDIGYGKNYEYAHDLENKKSNQQHFPDELVGRKYRKTDKK